MKTLQWIVVAGLSAGLLAACGGKKEYDAAGTFEATEIVVSAEATGRILNFDVQEGDEVVLGETLAQIDTVQLYLGKLQLEKNASSVRASRPEVSKQVLSLQEQIKQQKVERNRLNNLFAGGAATQKQLDDINAAIKILEGQLQASLSTLRNHVGSLNEQSSAIDIQIAQMEDKLSKCRAVAPVSGTVLAKYAEVGEFAGIGKPLAKVADLSSLYLRAYVSSAQLADLKLGDEVTVCADFGGSHKQEYSGVISWISSKSEFTPDYILTDSDRESTVYAIKIAVQNDGRIKIGTYGTVKF